MGPEDAILGADIDLHNCIEEKVLHDFAGHYNRADVFTLVVNRRFAQPCSPWRENRAPSKPRAWKRISWTRSPRSPTSTPRVGQWSQRKGLGLAPGSIHFHQFRQMATVHPRPPSCVV